MNIKPIKTHKIQPNENIFEILDKYLPKLEENSVVAITSKIVGICEGRVIKKESQKQKDELIKKEADYYLLQKRLGFFLTIKNNILAANAGIDESNSNGSFTLWPIDPQKSINTIRNYLVKKHTLKNLGVIITDSKLTPLRWGATGYAIAYSGFKALNSYVDKPDIFGRKLRVEKSNISDSLGTAAVAVMGEGNEQQPLALITDIPFVQFQQRNPTKEELDELKINLEDDVFASLLTTAPWEKIVKKERKK